MTNKVATETMRVCRVGASDQGGAPAARQTRTRKAVIAAARFLDATRGAPVLASVSRVWEDGHSDSVITEEPTDPAQVDALIRAHEQRLAWLRRLKTRLTLVRIDNIRL
jgi:hypothetical protein